MPTPDPDQLARALTRALPVTRVEGLRRLSGGASRETWSFDALDAAGRRHGLVLRLDPKGRGETSDRATEYELLQAVGSAGVPVPHVRLLLDPDDGLGSGFVMDRVEGETIARKILRDEEFGSARPKLAAQCGEIAARIHATSLATLPALATAGPRAQLTQYRDVLDMFGEPHPAFELAFQWLAANAPDEREPNLVHGDFRNGNFIIGPDGLRAVLDWELAHLGDPVEDLGWLCVRAWRFGVIDRVVGGFGDLVDLLDAYERTSGVAVSLDALRYWVVFGTVKWGVICVTQAFTHLTGAVRSVELATIGRRVAENEWDVLALLDGEW